MNQTIRRLAAGDAEAYWQLRLTALKESPEAFATTYEEALKREDPIAQTKKSLANTVNITLGAFSNQNLVGMVTLMPEKHEKLSHRANIVAMYVSTEVRRSGTGRALMEAIIAEGKAYPGIEKLNLSVVTTNEAAKRLYSTLGFYTFGIEEKALKDRDTYLDEEHMSLILT